MGITREQALDCFASDDLIGIGMEADAVRRGLHPEGVVSYVVERRVDLNLAPEALYERISGAEEMGATAILVDGRLPADCGIDWVAARLKTIREQWPALWIGGLSATSVAAIACTSGLGFSETLAQLKDAGLQSLSGEDAQILDDGIRQKARTPVCGAAEWLEIHRAAHGLGLRSSATMTFGQNETMEQRLEHLESIRRLQAVTGGFTAFTPSGFQHDISAGGRSLEEATSVEYLKTLAICRMYLDNIDNIQANWQTQGVKVLQMGLRFGSNDVGSVALEKTLGEAATEEDLRRVIRDAGFLPVQRDTVYATMFLN
jgi:cyclic dehypoxanthinyl futalosine synthase